MAENFDKTLVLAIETFAEWSNMLARKTVGDAKNTRGGVGGGVGKGIYEEEIGKISISGCDCHSRMLGMKE